MLDEEVTKEAYGDIREADGILRGKELGRKEGRLEGEKAGRLQGKTEDARNLKREGVDIALIAKCVGLSVEEIEAL